MTSRIINHHGNVEEVSERWQEHYDDYLASLDGRGGICARDAAEQYADDMMDEEVAAPRTEYVPSPEYLAWCALRDAEQLTETIGDPLLKDRRAA